MAALERWMCSACKRVWQERRSHYPVFTQFRGSVYNPFYIEPIVNKELLNQNLPEMEQEKYQPIKAARTEQTTSVFYDPMIQKFINMVMKGGNKDIAKNIIEKTLENIKRIQIEKYHKTSEEGKPKLELNAVKIFHQAVENCKPILNFTKIQKGGVLYNVPVACKPNYQRYKAMKWLIMSCRDKERKIPMEDKLAWEIINAFNNEGKSIRKKQELHRSCEENRAYAHFRW